LVRLLNLLLLICLFFYSNVIAETVNFNINGSEIPVILHPLPGKKVASTDKSGTYAIAFKGSPTGEKIKEIINRVLKYSKYKENYDYLESLRLLVVRGNLSAIEDVMSEISPHAEISFAEEIVARDLHRTGKDQFYKQQWYLKDLEFEDYNKKYKDYVHPDPKNIPVLVIIDAGFDLDNKDFAGRIYINEGEIPDNGIDDDGNGYIDDYKGVDVTKKQRGLDYCFKQEEFSSHGTSMLSIIASKTNNRFYMSGILPDEVKVLPIAASSDCKSVDYFLHAYSYILDLNERGVHVDVINMSFGSAPKISIEEEMFHLFGVNNIVIFASVGNDGSDFEKHPIYPAGYKEANIVPVGSINKSNKISAFSNYGEDVTIFMPGEEILQQVSPPIKYPKYITGSGTSHAAAIASAVFTSMLYVNPEYNAIKFLAKMFKFGVVEREKGVVSFTMKLKEGMGYEEE